MTTAVPVAKRIRRPRSPIWSIKTISIVTLLIVAIVAATVFLLGERSVLAEAEYVAIIVASLLFLFLAVGLYRGARVRKTEQPPQSFEFIDAGTPDASSALDGLSSVDDLGGAVVGLALMLVVGIFLVILLPIVINVVWLVLFLFVVALFWIFRAALRQVFARSRQCRGRFWASVGYASRYTLLYSGWLLIVLVVARALSER